MLPDRYNLANFRRTVKNPHLFYREYKRFVRWYFRLRHGEGIDVMAADWDNLIILDGCRYDHYYYAREQDFEGDLQPVISKGGHSWEFMQANFQNRQLHDTVYVTGNPHTPKLSDGVFYSIKHLYIDKFDDDVGTVMPEDVVASVQKVAAKFPNKRYIAHFMQPHEPMLGPTGKKVRERESIKGWDNYAALDEKHLEQTGILWYEAARQGKISHDELNAAYQENLNLVLKYVNELLNNLNGKTVITADHGDLMGERPFPFAPRYYGHPHDIYMQELCEVPWHEIESGKRREIVAEDPVKRRDIDPDVVKQRLRTLGYMTE